MAGILRKILHVGQSSPPKDDDSNVEYSFAIEYNGPPVSFDIPRAVPVDVDQLPTAATISSSYVLNNNISLPVIQPVVNTNKMKQNLARHKKIGSGLSNEPSIQVVSLDSLGQTIDGIGSCGIMQNSHVHDSLADDCKQGLGLHNKYMDSPHSDTTGSVLSSPSVSSSGVFSQKRADIHNNETTTRHVKRPPAVTFRDPESCDMVQGESNSNYSETQSMHAAEQSIERNGKKGSEGDGPCQIITAQLNVGGRIKAKASNGNAKVLVNDREITRKELWMLQTCKVSANLLKCFQFAGVNCEGKPSFWLSADGSYQEEGQKNEKGPIWKKTRIKLFCALLSLPVPPNVANPAGEDVSQRTLEQQVLLKLLLVGYQKSGTSTIYKQSVTDDYYGSITLDMQIGCPKGRERFEEEVLLENRKLQFADGPGSSGGASQIDGKTKYSLSPRLKAFSEWLVQVMVSGNLEVIFPAATREYAPFIQKLWNDAAFQATYNRRHELQMLPRIATYFLERAVEISRTDYEPSDMDILYQLIRLHPSSLGASCKWVGMFEDINMVLFCVSLTDYDEFWLDSNGVLINKMVASKQLFETIVSHPTLEQKDFLLILNKADLLLEKMEEVPLTRCEWFHDFNPVISHHNNNLTASVAQRAFHYIAVKFKRLFDSLTHSKLYVCMVTGLEPDSVDEAFRYAREILKWDHNDNSFINNEFSTTTVIEASTTS
ncbi:hypothetical protein GOBAR_AA09183 [Gossypium barbadense]|uniref:Uncharacterized protein n=1 Tax=Gossypium barbadense TaxID=3634 RepID=A0A2P5Y786_GOSBA|nr:hypothetical protein GOBAR_AA09183 [Gossypium barbadense]